ARLRPLHLPVRTLLRPLHEALVLEVEREPDQREAGGRVVEALRSAPFEPAPRDAVGEVAVALVLRDLGGREQPFEADRVGEVPDPPGVADEVSGNGGRLRVEPAHSRAELRRSHPGLESEIWPA